MFTRFSGRMGCTTFGAQAIADEDDEAVHHQGMGYYSGSNTDDLKMKQRITENLDGL